MAIGLDLDTEYANRTGIPGGGAGTLSAGGFADFFMGVWLYRPSATATHALTAGGSIVDGQGGARLVALGFNSTGVTLADLNLQVTFNSDGSGVQTFAGHLGSSFLDEWVYYFFYENAANDQVAGYIRLADLATAVTLSRANDNAGSQYVNTLTVGNVSGNNTVVLGNYAYARARDSSPTAADVLTYANSSATIAGDWGFWPLANNTDTADTSGNSRSLTFGGTLTSESSPAFGPTISTQPTAKTGYVGGTVRLTAKATGTAPLTAQWQDNSGGSFANISGATDVDGLTVSALTYAMNGRQYKVIYTDPNGSITSSIATLTVNTVDVYLWNTSVQVGNDVWLRDPTAFSSAGAYTIAAAQGSYTLTGFATGLRADRRMTAAQGSYTLTGIAAGLIHKFPMLATSGSYSLIGNAAGLIAARRIVAAQGSYTLTGIAAGLIHKFPMLATSGSYSLIGNAAGLIATRRIVAAQGSYALTGFAAGLKADRRIVEAAGSYGLTGNAAGTRTARSFAANAGAYALAGQAAGIILARQISIGAGGYTLTGFDATLTYDAGANILSAVSGSYTLTGTAVGLSIITVPAAPGTGGTNLYRGFLPLAWRVAHARFIDDEDKFPRLAARHVAKADVVKEPPSNQVATASAFADADEFAALQVRSLYRATASAINDDDQFAQLSAKHGMPSRALLAWWMQNAA